MSESAFHPGERIGHYRLIERVGSGGQGEVWRARDERFERDVALKILPAKALADESTRERFRREARAVGRLNHPNIATAHDFDTSPVDFLVTEFVSGKGLDQKLSSGALPEDAVIELGLQLAAGLEAAHRQGIIHRDLKPGNLRISESGTLKILDFGLAEMFDPNKDIASVETITINMTLTGTVPYMAPEQFTGISDQRTDIWSAGAVLYEMATGRLPFTETQVQELRSAIQFKHPNRPREVNAKISEGLEKVILRCLQKNPDQRYQSAKELREDLGRVQQGRKTVTEQKLRARRFALGVLAAVVAISGLGVIEYWPQIRERLWPTSAEKIEQFRLMAILPVSSAGDSPSEDALVRGMAETVTASLARSTVGQKIQLIPPGELLSRGAKTSEAASREFGVERVLEVSVQHSGNQVRATCSLIDPKTHRVLNACTVDGDKADLFALQDKLVTQVIAMLPADSRSPQTEPTVAHAENPLGYEHYLKGKGYLLEYQKPENISAAIKEFEQTLQLSPNYAPARAGLGQAYWLRYKADKNKEWIDKALAECNAAAESNPKSVEGHVCLSNVFRSHGQYDKALQQIQTAIKLDNEDVEVQLALGDTLDKLNRRDEAAAAFKQAASLNPNYWAVYNWAGSFYYGHANYAEAEKMFRQASELAPGNNLVLENLGGIYLLEGRYQDAIDMLNRSIQIRPTLTAYSNLGAALFYLHKFPESVVALRKASELDSQNYIAWGDLADALYWTPNQRSEADPVYRKAITLAEESAKINPKDSGAFSSAASYNAMLDNRQAALAALGQALALSPDDPDVMFRAAVVHNHFGNREETLQWLKKATEAGFSRTTVRDTPDFAQLQQDPAFRGLTVR
jgi:serine/threonine-protein kinase